MEQVGHNDEVAVRRQLIRDQLGIDEAVADHICQQENGPLGGLIRGTSNIDLDCDG